MVDWRSCNFMESFRQPTVNDSLNYDVFTLMSSFTLSSKAGESCCLQIGTIVRISPIHYMRHLHSDIIVVILKPIINFYTVIH